MTPELPIFDLNGCMQAGNDIFLLTPKVQTQISTAYRRISAAAEEIGNYDDVYGMEQILSRSDLKQSLSDIQSDEKLSRLKRRIQQAENDMNAAIDALNELLEIEKC